MIGKLFTLLGGLIFSLAVVAQSTQDDYEKAIQAYHLGDAEAAYVHLKNALNENPKDISSKILMGKVLLSKGLVEGALMKFDEANRAGADPNLITLPIAKAHLLIEQFDEIIELNDIGLSRTNKVDFLLIQGNAYLNIADRSNAISRYKEALSLDPQNIKVLTNIGYYYLFTRDKDGIRTTMRSLLTISPRDFRVLHLQGQIAKASKDFGIAHEYFILAHEANPNDSVIKRSLAGSYIQQEDFVNAQKIVAEILKQTPDDPIALLFKGRLQRETASTDDIDLIIEKLNQTLTLIPDEIKSQKNELFLIRGLANYLEKNYERAASELETYLVKQRDSTTALGVLADTYIKLKQDFKALILLETNQQYVIKNVKVGLVLCNLYINANRTFKCEELLDQLTAQHGHEPTFTFMRMRSLMARGRYDDAIEIYERVFADADHPSILLTSIELYTSHNQYSTALRQVGKLIQAYPQDQQYKLLKAELLLNSQNYVGAKTLIDDILQQDPSLIKAKFMLARIYLLSRQYSEGINIIKPLHIANPKVVSVSILYAQFLMAIDDSEQALTVLREAVPIDDRPRTISELLVKANMNKGYLSAALSEINHLLRLHFLQPEYLLTKAEIFALMRSSEKAKAQLDIVYGVWREQPNNLSRLTDKQIDVADYAGALKSIEQAILLSPNVLEYEIQLVRIHLLQDNLSKAQDLVSDLDKRYAKNSLLSLIKGEVARQQGQLQLAHTLFMESYTLNNSYSLAAVKLYQLALQGFEADRFLSTMNNHLDRYQNAHLIRNLVADFHMLNLDYTLALVHYRLLENVMGLPNKENVLNNIANIELSFDNLDLALSYAQRAYDINSRSAAVVNTKAWILAKQGAYAKSLALMRQAISLRAFDSDFQYHLSYVLAKLNRREEAIEALEKALNHDSRFDQREAAIELYTFLSAG
jgi:putative PEP-CTERM system TPR-repeat lipoprotein